MKSGRAIALRVSNCLTTDTVRLLFLLAIFSCPLILRAQTAGGIASHPLPINGFYSSIDAAGNVYFTGSNGIGPVTAGSAQTKSGGGTCYISAYPIWVLPATCSDTYLGKADPAGNIVFGTALGGPTADGATALAVDAAGNLFVTGFTGGSFPNHCRRRYC